MLIAGINGSPNKNGNTVFLLNKILEEVRKLDADTELINVQNAVMSSKIPFCTACSTPCRGSCFEGTELKKAYDIITKADGIIIGSPVYFGTVSAQLKAFFDKSRGIRGQKAWINKVGAGVTVGASKYGGQETAIRAIHDIMLVHGMIIVGDGQVEMGAGHHGVCAQKPSGEDSFALSRAEILAKELVEVCQATQSLRKI